MRTRDVACHLNRFFRFDDLNSFNLQLFQHIYVVAPSEGTLLLAKILGEQLTWLAPASLFGAWLWGDEVLRKTAVSGALAACLALAIAQVFAQAFYIPRPFASGFGPPLIPHAADSSFPSDHLTLLGAVAASD